MIPTNIRNIKKGILLFVGILGVWLVYWDITDSVNSFLHNNNIPPLLVGAIIIMIVGYFGIKVFR
jgi:Ca2+/H+ antiporter